MCDKQIINQHILLDGGAQITGVITGSSLAVPVDCGCAPAPPRVPQVHKEVTKVPGVPGQVKEVIKRLPTPTADLIEKTFIEQPGQDTINVIYERPTTPPPNIVEKRVVEPQPPAQVNCFERRVPHRPRDGFITGPSCSIGGPVAPLTTVTATPITTIGPRPNITVTTTPMTQQYMSSGPYGATTLIAGPHPSYLQSAQAYIQSTPTTTYLPTASTTLVQEGMPINAGYQLGPLGPAYTYQTAPTETIVSQYRNSYIEYQ